MDPRNISGSVITKFNTWKYIVPFTMVLLSIGLVLSFIDNTKATFLANILILLGIILTFYSLYLFTLR